MEESNKDTSVPVFQLQGRSSDFNKKSKDIFGGLQVLEDKHVEHEKHHAGEEENFFKKDPGLEDTETIVSGFKKPSFPSDRANKSRSPVREFEDRSRSHNERSRPEKSDNRSKPYTRPQDFRHRGRFGRSGRVHKTPDYKIHPERWTEYSLEDVGADDMSGAAMKRAAFEFLEQRRAERDAKSNEEKVNLDDSACSKGLFTFKRPSKNKGQGQQSEVTVSRKITENSEVTEADEDVSLSDDFGNHSNKTQGQGQNEDLKQDESKKPPEKVVFQSRKIKKRSIRVKDSSDSD